MYPTCKDIYKCANFDPEGFMGNLTSIVLTYLGYKSGRILIYYNNHQQRQKLWIFWGIFYGSIGLLLCGASKENGIIPINKNIWSVSFIFIMAGLAFLVLTIFYQLIDIVKLWSGWPFIDVGMNSIAIYLLHEVFSGYFPLSFFNDGSHG